MDFEDGVLVIDRELSEFDRRAFAFFDLLDEIGIDYLVVSGYLLLLTGRQRMTEDVDLILSVRTTDRLDELATRLGEAGYVANPPPLDRLPEFIEDGHVGVHAEGARVPTFDLSLGETQLERDAFADSLSVEVSGKTLQVTPFEQQIAYKLSMLYDPTDHTAMDFLDALHLYRLFEDHLDMDSLRSYTQRLNAAEALDELRTASRETGEQ
jgi:hypothetical protein